MRILDCLWFLNALALTCEKVLTSNQPKTKYLVIFVSCETFYYPCSLARFGLVPDTTNSPRHPPRYPANRCFDCPLVQQHFRLDGVRGVLPAAARG